MRPVMTIVSRPQPGGSETVHVVTYGSERFSVAFRSVDPVVQIQGVALRWEAIVRVPDGRAFHGYGPVREFAPAGEVYIVDPEGRFDDENRALGKYVPRTSQHLPESRDFFRGVERQSGN